MRSLDSARAAYALVVQNDTISALKSAIESQHREGDARYSRSLLWKACLCGSSQHVPQWLSQQDDARASYDDLRGRFIRPLAAANEREDLDDPLSSSTSWDNMRNDESLRREIYQDVDRCMPENLYFRQPETQAMLVDLLFLWAKLNADVGYRQGMHEIAAPVLWVVERDAVDPNTRLSSRGDAREPAFDMFDAQYIEHDTFTLFNHIMAVLKPAFEHVPSGRAVAGKTSSMSSRCEHIIHDYVARAEPELAEHLVRLDLVPQVFLLRWIRLLFGREFTFDQTLSLWDRMFCTEYSSDLIDMICVAMIVRIREQLLEADYNGALQLLMKFPSSAAGDSVHSFVDYAAKLKKTLNADRGSRNVSNHSDESVFGSDIPPPPIPAASPILAAKSAIPRSPVSASRTNLLAQVPGNLEHLIQDATRGLFTRGERMRLNQAVRDVVVEVKKNVQNVSARSQHTRSSSRTLSSTDLTDAAQAEHRLHGLQTRNKALAGMLDTAVATLWEAQRTIQDKPQPSAEDVQAMTAAIAKVQFVQIYLADPTLALPIDAGSREAMTSAGELESEGKINGPPIAPVKSNDVRSDAQRSSTQDAEDSSVVAKQDTTSAGAPEPNSRPIERRAEVRSTATRPKTSTAIASKPARPALEQSSFSWMLGQDESPPGGVRKTFMSASPYREGSYRGSASSRGTNAFLFGEEGEDPFSRPDNRTGKTSGKAVDDKHEPLPLGTIRGKPPEQQ